MCGPCGGCGRGGAWRLECAEIVDAQSLWVCGDCGVWGDTWGVCRCGCVETVECARVGNMGVWRLWRLWLCMRGGSGSRGLGVFRGTGIRVGCAETHLRVAVPRADSRSGPVLRRVIRIAASQQAPN